MHRNIPIKFVQCALAVFAILIAPDVRASTIIQTAETNGPTFNGSGFGGIFSQFDPSLGTLKAAILSFSGVLAYDTTFKLNLSIDPSACGVSIVCGATFNFSTGYSFNAPGFPLTNFMDGADFFATENFNGFVDPDNPDANSGPLQISFVGSPADLSGYVGNASVGVVGAISEDSDFCSGGGGTTPPGNGTCTQSDNLDMITTLTYEFAPVPAPASFFI